MYDGALGGPGFPDCQGGRLRVTRGSYLAAATAAEAAAAAQERTGKCMTANDLEVI